MKAVTHLHLVLRLEMCVILRVVKVWYFNTGALLSCILPIFPSHMLFVRYEHYQPRSDAVNNTTLDWLIKTARFLQWRQYKIILPCSDFCTGRDYISNCQEVQYQPSVCTIQIAEYSRRGSERKWVFTITPGRSASVQCRRIINTAPRRVDQSALYLTERHRRWGLTKHTGCFYVLSETGEPTKIVRQRQKSDSEE